MPEHKSLKQARRTAFVIALLTAGLAFAKFVVGKISGSLALSAEKAIEKLLKNELEPLIQPTHSSEEKLRSQS